MIDNTQASSTSNQDFSSSSDESLTEVESESVARSLLERLKAQKKLLNNSFGANQAI